MSSSFRFNLNNFLNISFDTNGHKVYVGLDFVPIDRMVGEIQGNELANACVKMVNDPYLQYLEVGECVIRRGWVIL